MMPQWSRLLPCECQLRLQSSGEAWGGLDPSVRLAVGNHRDSPFLNIGPLRESSRLQLGDQSSRLARSQP